MREHYDCATCGAPVADGNYTLHFCSPGCLSEMVVQLRDRIRVIEEFTGVEGGDDE